MAICYFINWIVAAETIKGGKLFKGGYYLRKYSIMYHLDKISKNFYWFRWNSNKNVLKTGGENEKNKYFEENEYKESFSECSFF